MEAKDTQKTKKKGKRKMIGWIIALIIVVIAFGIGALFCAPWSPLHIAEEKAKSTPAIGADIGNAKGHALLDASEKNTKESALASSRE
jgi:hypothetical protein